ncbi:hypothetical protein PS2_0174 [Aeromonas phage PS2]|nr:hypothetical protein PS2_0174 [Aeromonas phage PS2]
MVANEHKLFPKKINDPLFSIVKQFFKQRHEIVNEQGNLVERYLADTRYSGLEPEDFMIESVYTDDDGSKKICLVKRAKSFARVDIPVSTVNLLTIAKDFNREVVVCNNLTDFKNKFNRKEVQGKLLNLVWRNALGYCVKHEDAFGLAKFNELMGDVFFEQSEFYREDETYISKSELTSGGVLITDDSVGTEPVHLFVEELVQEQLDLNTVTDNFPSSFSGKRGEEVRFTNLFTANGVDVTAKTELTYRSKNGFISGKQSPNKLESIFTFIKGSAGSVLSDEVEISINVTHDDYIFSKVVTVGFVVNHDEVGNLIVSAQTETIRTSTLYKLGIVVKCQVNGTEVIPDVYPNWLTCKLTNDKYTLDKTWKDGLLYIGVPTTILPDYNSSFKDLIIGEFSYQGNKGNLFVELEVTKPLGEQEQLELVNLEPVLIKGERGDIGNVNYQVTLKGSVLALNQCGLNTGLVGQRQLVNVTQIDTESFGYGIVQDSNSPGMVITDSINLGLKHPASNGELHTRSDKLYVEVIKVSTVDLRPRTSFNKTVTKYQKGPLPFQVYINGNESSDKVRSVNVENSETSPVIINFDPWTIKETWIVVDGGTQTSLQTVNFKFKILVDGIEKDFSWEQEFEILGYTGPDLALIPGIKDIEGRELESGEFDVCVYNKRERINNRVLYKPELSTLHPNVTFSGLKKVTDQFITIGYSLIEQGLVTSILRCIDPNEPGLLGELSVITDISPSYPLKVIMDGVVSIESYLSNKLNVSVIYNGASVSLNDPRVSVNVSLSSIEVFVKSIEPNGIILETTKSVPMGEDDISEIDLEVRLLDDVSLYRKEVGGLVQVTRRVVSGITVELLTNNLTASTKQAILYKLKDQAGSYIYNARTAGVGYQNRDNNLPTIIGTDSFIELIDPVNGIYQSHLMLSHLGGNGGFIISVNLGGITVSSGKVGIEVNPVIPKVSEVSDGIAVLNVNSDIDFTVKLDKYNEPDVPLNAIEIGKVDFDPTFITVINSKVKLVEDGKYRINVSSSGKIGETQLRIILTDNERSWDVIVNVEMKR